MSASYYPPVENVPIFDSLLFSITNENQFLTEADANKLYLEFPNGQGNETIPDVIVNGNMTISQNLILDGTSGTNYVEFPDGSRQYTIPSTPLFQPVYKNFADYNSSSSAGYSEGPLANFTGTWGIYDWAILRIRQQGCWNNTGSGWNNYASTSGILLCRPYYMTGSWSVAGVGNGNIVYPLNIYADNFVASVSPTGSPVYFSNSVNNGTLTKFVLNGVDNSFSFRFISNGITGGWQTTIGIEYMSRSVAGGNVVFITGTGTNNVLP